MVLEQAEAAEAHYGFPQRHTLSVALVGVMGYGRIIESGPDFEDPPSTWRCSNYSITGPILLPATGQARAAKPLLRRFTTTYDVVQVPSLLDADDDDVDQVLDAMYDADD